MRNIDSRVHYGVMRLIRTTCLIATSLLVIPVAARGQQATTTTIDVSKLGPQVGERVPDFNLRDQNGSARTLQSILGSKGAMLVFFRSADW